MFEGAQRERQPLHPTRTEHCWSCLNTVGLMTHSRCESTDGLGQQPSDTDGTQYRHAETVRFMRAAIHRLLD